MSNWGNKDFLVLAAKYGSFAVSEGTGTITCNTDGPLDVFSEEADGSAVYPALEANDAIVVAQERNDPKTRMFIVKDFSTTRNDTGTITANTITVESLDGADIEDDALSAASPDDEIVAAKLPFYARREFYKTVGTGPDAVAVEQIVGVSNREALNTSGVASPGWILRKVAPKVKKTVNGVETYVDGRRAGRVQYETLVTMGSGRNRQELGEWQEASGSDPSEGEYSISVDSNGEVALKIHRVDDAGQSRLGYLRAVKAGDAFRLGGGQVSIDVSATAFASDVFTFTGTFSLGSLASVDGTLDFSVEGRHGGLGREAASVTFDDDFFPDIDIIGNIPKVTILGAEGDAVELDVSPYFNSAATNFSMTSDDESIFTVALKSGATHTFVLTSVSNGRTTATLSVEDGSNENKVSRLTVSVEVMLTIGRSGTIPDRILYGSVGSLAGQFYDVSNYFIGSATQYDWSLSGVSGQKFTASISDYGIVEFETIVARGMDEITVVAEIGSHRLIQFLDVTVVLPITTSGTIPTQRSAVGATTTFDVSSYFTGDVSSYALVVGDASLLTASIDTDGVITMTPASDTTGTTTITVTATDVGGATAEQSVSVEVVEFGAVTSAAYDLNAWGVATTLDVSTLFNGDTSLTTYAITTAPDASIATAAISGASLTVTPVTGGDTHLVVTAMEGLHTATKRIDIDSRIALTRQSATASRVIAYDDAPITLRYDAYFDGTIVSAGVSDPGSLGNVVAQDETFTLTASGDGEADLTLAAHGVDASGRAATVEVTLPVLFATRLGATSGHATVGTYGLTPVEISLPQYFTGYSRNIVFQSHRSPSSTLATLAYEQPQAHGTATTADLANSARFDGEHDSTPPIGAQEARWYFNTSSERWYVRAHLDSHVHFAPGLDEWIVETHISAINNNNTGPFSESPGSLDYRLLGGLNSCSYDDADAAFDHLDVVGYSGSLVYVYHDRSDGQIKVISDYDARMGTVTVTPVAGNGGMDDFVVRAEKIDSGGTVYGTPPNRADKTFDLDAVFALAANSSNVTSGIYNDTFNVQRGSTGTQRSLALDELFTGTIRSGTASSSNNSLATASYRRTSSGQFLSVNTQTGTGTLDVTVTATGEDADGNDTTTVVVVPVRIYTELLAISSFTANLRASGESLSQGTVHFGVSGEGVGALTFIPSLTGSPGFATATAYTANGGGVTFTAANLGAGSYSTSFNVVIRDTIGNETSTNVTVSISIP